MNKSKIKIMVFCKKKKIALKIGSCQYFAKKEKEGNANCLPMAAGSKLP